MALLSEVATVEFDECQTDTEKLAKDISSLGFDVELIGISTKAEFSTVKFKVPIICWFSWKAVSLFLFICVFIILEALWDSQYLHCTDMYTFISAM